MIHCGAKGKRPIHHNNWIERFVRHSHLTRRARATFYFDAFCRAFGSEDVEVIETYRFILTGSD
jgi:hypothetical protein